MKKIISQKRNSRILRMVDAMQTENYGSTSKEVPKNVSMNELNFMSNRETPSSISSYQPTAVEVTNAYNMPKNISLDELNLISNQDAPLSAPNSSQLTSEEVSIANAYEVTKNISLDEPNFLSNFDQDAPSSALNSSQLTSDEVIDNITRFSVLQAPLFDDLTTDSIGMSPSLLQTETLPQAFIPTSISENNVHKNDSSTTSRLSHIGSPNNRNRTVSESSFSSSSSSSCSGSSPSSESSSSDTTSGKDFSPDDEDGDPDYMVPAPRRRFSFHLDEPETDQQENNNVPNRRRRGGILSKKQEAKRLRNSGQEYVSTSKLRKSMPKKQLGPPCGPKCRLQCSQKISEDVRQHIFDEFWKLGDLTRQRDYIAKCIDVIKPRYQYKVHDNQRGPKHSFHFEIYGCKYRVCKIFFKNTLSINNRPIATVIAKIKDTGIVEDEKRGKHGKQRKVGSDIIQNIKDHIDSIPRIESHYLRQQTSREYIDGGKNLSDLFHDYKEDCEKKGIEAAKLHTYRKIFKEFNISFFIPKKDQCELCTMFKNNLNPNEELKSKYETHLLEKELCRKEKSVDKSNVKNNFIVACYDLQAILPLPKGDISTLYYKSKLNVCNFTITELARDYCDCFAWSEIEALRGANEIATCVLKYLSKKALEVNDDNLDFIFYSDNCCGQQKNQFMFCMYVYALSVLKIKSITHKFLISGHTQNENDSVHSVIEKSVKKCLRSGPIYTPDQYVTIIRTARRNGNPYKVTEMCYSDFYDIKNIAETIGGRFTHNTLGETIKLSDIKVIKFEKNIATDTESQSVSIFYKTSYTDIEFKEVQFATHARSSRTRNTNFNLQNINLKQLYPSRLPLTERKKKDLKSLITSNIIPQNYAASYYNSILD